jgi:hypothetical protein
MGAAEEPVHLAGATLGSLEVYLQEGRFDCERKLRCIDAHPMVILARILQVNRFFVPPDQYLHELRERRMARQAVSSDLG